MSSQHSYEAILNRFKLGNALVQGWADYNPPAATINKASLAAFVLDVEGSNTLTTSTEEAVGVARAARSPLVFEIDDTNPACLESRVRGIVNLCKSDPDSNELSTAAKKVNTILKKIRPTYKKKAPGAPRGTGNSPMERSFASAVGHGRAVITIITGLGALYAPSDPNLTVAQMTALVNSIEAANETVQQALEDYGNANKARLKLYADKKTGLVKRRINILNYLASFPGLKKSDHYREFKQAIEGT